MKKITQNKTIAVYIPMMSILTDADLQPLIMQGVVFDLATERVADDEQEYKLIYFNTIEKELLKSFLTKGFRIDILNGLQTPYVHIDKSELDKPFSDTEILLKDYTISYVDDAKDKTKCYVEIGHYSNGINRADYTKSEELVQWSEIYGNENVLIIDKIVKDENI